MIAALVLALSAVPTPTPTYLVERVVTVNERTVRISVFRDGMSVLAQSTAGDRPEVRRRRLSAEELAVVTQVVSESYTELDRYPESSEGPGTGSVEYRLAPEGAEPLRLRRSLTAVRSLAGSRLDQALDDLTAELEAGAPSREDLSAWNPKEGDRVQLDDGRVVEVLELLDSPAGPLVRIGAGPVSEFLPMATLRSRAVRRVP